MYSLKNLWEKEPVAIANAVRSVLMVLILLGVLSMDEKQLAGIVLALGLVLDLFVHKTVFTKPTVDTLVNTALYMPVPEANHDPGN